MKIKQINIIDIVVEYYFIEQADKWIIEYTNLDNELKIDYCCGEEDPEEDLMIAQINKLFNLNY